jgi:hypothetical protein
MALTGSVSFRVFLLLSLGFHASNFFAEETPSPAVWDWLPTVIHENDPLPITFSRPGETLALLAVRFDAEGKESDRTLAVANEKKDGTKTTLAFRIPSRGTEWIRFFSKAESATKPIAAIRLLRPESAWPAIRFESGRMLQADTDEALVLVSRRMELKPDRTCRLVKGLLRNSTVAPEDFPENQRLLVAPADIGRLVWNEREKKAEYEFDGLIPDKCLRQNRFRLLPNTDLHGTAAIVGTAASTAKLLSEMPSDKPFPYIILWLPAHDLAAPTEPQLYRAVLEHLLARLAIAGTRRLTVIPPATGGVPAAKLNLLWAAVRDVVTAWGGEFAEWPELREPDLWRLDGVQPSNAAVYGVRLNAEGRKMIGKKLAELLD